MSMSTNPDPTAADRPDPAFDVTALNRFGSTADVAVTTAPDGFPTVPGYVISHEVARGGMGRILAAREVALGREVAIKVLLPGANPARFVSEAKITARLPHPGIPPIYAIGTLADGSPFLSMKFVHGSTLAVDLRARPEPTADLPRFVQVFEQVCQAVGFAHARSILHRDLKPTNIMLGAFGEVHVMDWGLAKEVGLDTDDTEHEPSGSLVGGAIGLTVTGSVMGTPAFMSPEQARGDAVDVRTDVFALGGILCNLLTGQPVHTGASASDTIQKAATGQLAETHARLDACGADPELIAVAKQCLAVDRTERPADGQAVATLIAAYRRGVETRLHQAEADRAAAVVREAEAFKRRRQFYRLGGAVVAILVMGIVGTSVGLVRANRAAANERIARDEAVEQQTKAEGRLTVIRATINQFTNDLPSIGENQPLSDGLRTELLGLSKKLVTSIRDQNDLNDTYDFGTYALAVREARDAAARNDSILARRKLLTARDGFQRILDSNPQLIDRAKNNLALALTELGRLDTIEKKYAEAEANLRTALALRRDVAANPHGDETPFQIETAIASTLLYYGRLDIERKRYDSATAMLREAKALLEKALPVERDRDYELTRLNLTHIQTQFAWIATQSAADRGDSRKIEESKQVVIGTYEEIIQQLEADLERMPNSAGLRATLAGHAGYLGHYFIDTFKDYPRAVKYCEIAVRNRRWFWDSKEIAELRDKLGENYYELGLFAARAKQPEESLRNFRHCLAFWELGVRELEAKGVSAADPELIDRKILRMLAQGRCGMHADVAPMAAELFRLAQQSSTPKRQKQNYSTQSAVGYGFCAVAFPPGSKEREEFFKKAMVSLRQGIAYGYKSWHWLETDEDFDPMRAWPEFNQAVAEWKAAAQRSK
jgi:tetratricopeptide (TPR) repeat protein